MTGAMKPYRVTVDARYRSRPKLPGRCYEIAFKYFTGYRDDPALQLVHGTLHIVGNPYPHAWVEMPGSWVFDPADQTFYERDAYYRVERATVACVYTVTEADKQALRTGHYGPRHSKDPGDEA